ncbi:MAG TPA: hypothetical protein PLE18_13250 [Candidatus Sumerlaeota bacterium]|nr:hypothetical protein [Candidatus Sumerlaeota bacterium]
MMKIDEGRIRQLLTADEPDCDAILWQFEPLISALIIRNGWGRYADDLAQEARLAILATVRSHRYDEQKGRIFSYFYRIVQNAMATWMREFVYNADGCPSNADVPARSRTPEAILRDVRKTRAKSYADKVRLRSQYGERVMRMPIVEVHRICRAAQSALAGSPLEMILDVMSPRQLVHFIFIFSNLRVKIPSFASLIKSVPVKK